MGFAPGYSNPRGGVAAAHEAVEKCVGATVKPETGTVLHLIQPHTLVPFIAETGGRLDSIAIEVLRRGSKRAAERSTCRAPGLVQPADEGRRRATLYSSIKSNITTRISIKVQWANAHALGWRSATTTQFAATSVHGKPPPLTRSNSAWAALDAACGSSYM